MRFFKYCLIVIATLILFFASVANAQPQNPDAPDDVPVPITGLEYLLIAGGAFGGYKVFKKKIKGTD